MHFAIDRVVSLHVVVLCVCLVFVLKHLFHIEVSLQFACEMCYFVSLFKFAVCAIMTVSLLHYFAIDMYTLVVHMFAVARSTSISLQFAYVSTFLY